MTFKADKVKLKVHADNSAAGTGAADGGELAIVGNSNANATLKRYNGSAWEEIGATYTGGTGITIDSNNQIDLDVNSLSTQTGLARTDHIAVSKGTTTGKTQLQDIPIKRFKDCGELVDPLTNSEKEKVIQVKEVGGAVTNSSLAIHIDVAPYSGAAKSVIFRVDYDGPGAGSQEYFEIGFYQNDSGSIGWDSQGSARDGTTAAKAWYGQVDIGNSSMDTNLNRIKDFLEGSPTSTGDTNNRNFTGSNWTVTKDTNAKKVIITADNAAAAWDFTIDTNNTINSVNILSTTAYSTAAATYRYELHHPLINHLGNVNTANIQQGDTLKYDQSSQTYLPSSNSAFTVVATTTYYAHHQSSRAANFPLNSGAWTADFVSATEYSGSSWADLDFNGRNFLTREVFINFDDSTGHSFKVKGANNYSMSFGNRICIEIINLDTNDLTVNKNASTEPDFIVPQSSSSPLSTFTVGPQQKAMLIKNEAGAADNYVVAILSV